MKDITLVIMAAGIGSRYCNGIKQLQSVGKHGELIIDYSINDALEAGFNKIVFVIRKDMEQDFYDIIGKRIEKICKVEYVFQSLDDLPEGFSKPVNRTKPWGTGQAVLCCKNVIDGPFAVINADDYYGKEAFVEIYNYLTLHHSTKFEYCMVAFNLNNTLSDNGGVTRGVCCLKDSMLSNITETYGIVRGENGNIVDKDANIIFKDALVSMNMWGLTPDYFDILEQGFVDFLTNLDSEYLKSEYLLPTIMGGLLKNNKASIKVLRSSDKWFGITYIEDKENVIKAFEELIDHGVYKENLYS